MNVQKSNKFFKDLRTNWKYVLIVAMLAFFVCGGVLSYYHWWLPKQEISVTQTPVIKKTEKLEKIEEITKLPTIVGFTNNVEFGEDVKEIYIEDKYAYLIKQKEIIHIVDISNPSSPKIVTDKIPIVPYLKSTCQNVFILDKYAYVTEPSFDKFKLLDIIDISDPSQLKIAGSLSDLKLPRKSDDPIGSNKNVTGFNDIYVLDKYAYAVDTNWNTFFVIDISNPKNPVMIKHLFLDEVISKKSGFRAEKIYIFEKKAYVVLRNFDLDYKASIIVIDISEPASPEIAGSIEDQEIFADIVDFFITDKYIYKITKNNLSIIDISAFFPKLLSTISISDGRFKIYVAGRYAYLFGGSTLIILDVFNSEKPEIKFSISDSKIENIENVYIGGRFIYIVASGSNNFVIIDKKGETVFIPKPISIFSKEELKLEEKFIEKNEREIAFVQQNGDVWVVSKDLKKKYKITDSLEKLYYSALAEKRLSPNGKYIISKEFEGYTTCCGGDVPNIPTYALYIEKIDGTNKVKIERPILQYGLMYFDNWLPDSKRILLHFSDLDEATQGSPFYEVGLDGKNPKIYTEIFKFEKEGVETGIENFTEEDIARLRITVIGTGPVYSPNGEKIAFIRNWDEIRLKDIKTKETKTILKSDSEEFGFVSVSDVLIWSEDSNLLLVKRSNNVSVFNKEGDVVLETALEAEEIEDIALSPDNKYLAGVYKMKGERADIIFFINLITKEKKEFKLPEFKDFSENLNIDSLIFLKSNRLYYRLALESLNPGAEEPTSQLWVINTNTWKNYKAADNVLEAVKIP